MQDVKFYRCTLCGNVVEKIVNGGGTLSCCGKEMEELVPNSTSAAQEKHVPVYETLDNGEMLVRVGSIEHPMTAEHHIGWIAVAYEDVVIRKELAPTSAPQAVFSIPEGYHGKIYAWCNLHGLWSADF